MRVLDCSILQFTLSRQYSLSGFDRGVSSDTGNMSALTSLYASEHASELRQTDRQTDRQAPTLTHTKMYTLTIIMHTHSNHSQVSTH